MRIEQQHAENRSADNLVRARFEECGQDCPRSPIAAFTLLELLIAVMIFAIVLIAINTVFYSALRLRNKTSEILDASHSVEQGLAFLRRDLQGVVPPGGVLAQSFKIGPVSAQGAMSTSTGSGSSLGTGTSVSTIQTPGIQFCTTTGIISENEPWGDIQRVTYQLQTPADRSALGKDLVRSVNRNLLAITSEEPLEQRLLTDVETLEFECYSGTEWRTAWDTTLTDVGLPTAVRVRIQFATERMADNRSRQPLEMVVPLVAQALTNQAQNIGGLQ